MESTYASLIALADEILGEGISASGLSAETDGGAPGPAGGGPSNGADEDQETPPGLPEEMSDPAAGTGPITFVGNDTLPWDRSKTPGKRRFHPGWHRPDKAPVRHQRESLGETEGYLLGHPTDATQTGMIQIAVLDNINLRVHAPSRIFEQVEAYTFFAQFQFMLPHTPMLNANVMESISSWWRNFAIEGDLLEIDCTSGFAKVTNTITGNFYGLGCLGNIPTYTGIVS